MPDNDPPNQTDDKADVATIEKTDLPVESEVDTAAADSEEIATNLGKIGKWLGGGKEKAGNIVGLTIIGGFIVLTLASGATLWVSLAKSPAEVPNLHVIITSVVSIITAGLGYLFGESKR